MIDSHEQCCKASYRINSIEKPAEYIKDYSIYTFPKYAQLSDIVRDTVRWMWLILKESKEIMNLGK